MPRSLRSCGHSLVRGLALSVLLTSCSLLGLLSDKQSLEGLNVTGLRNMNQSMAVSVDVVFLYDAKLADKLPKAAPKWFADKAQYTHEYAGRMDVLNLEMISQDETGNFKVAKRWLEAEVVLVFANYLNKAAQGRVDISACRWARIVLMNEQWKVVEVQKVPELSLLSLEGDRHESQCGS